MRIKRFIQRFKNQYRIHHRWASNWMIIRMAWIQSKKREKKIVDLKNLKVQNLKDIKDKL